MTERAHDLELVHPFYGSKDGHTAFCTCGWNSEEHKTPGQATLAGWNHIRQQRIEPKQVTS
jgi:hypothetical protein